MVEVSEVLWAMIKATLYIVAFVFVTSVSLTCLMYSCFACYAFLLSFWKRCTGRTEESVRPFFQDEFPIPGESDSRTSEAEEHENNDNEDRHSCDSSPPPYVIAITCPPVDLLPKN